MEICQALYKNGESIKSIAEKTNKSEDVIINYLKLLGIHSEDLEKRMIGENTSGSDKRRRIS